MGKEKKVNDAKKLRATAKKARQARKGQERADRKTYGRGKSGEAAKAKAVSKKAALDKMDRVTDRVISSSDTPTVDDGAAMKKNYGSSMNASQDKSASMDDYSHEKKLKADGRYEAAHGKMAKANNDFDHAHALKKDAAHDAKGRHSIMRHMKGFGASMKIDNMGASLPGTPAGSKSKRSSMTNLGTKAMAVKESVAGQSLQTDTDNFVTKSEYPFVRPGDRVDGLKKFKSGGNKGLSIDNDYSLETKSNNKAPYNRPPSKFAGDYKVFQAVEKTNVSKPTKAMKTGEKLTPAKKAMKTGVKKGKPTAQAIVIDMSKKKSKT